MVEPVERVCICQQPEQHTPACDEQHRRAFFMAWRGLRAQLGWPDEKENAA